MKCCPHCGCSLAVSDDELERDARAIASRYARTLGALRGSSRARPLPQARQAVAHALKRKGASVAQIARLLQKHPTSVLYFLQKPLDLA